MLKWMWNVCCVLCIRFECAQRNIDVIYIHNDDSHVKLFVDLKRKMLSVYNVLQLYLSWHWLADWLTDSYFSVCFCSLCTLIHLLASLCIYILLAVVVVIVYPFSISFCRPSSSSCCHYAYWYEYVCVLWRHVWVFGVSH